mgnify:CR=1 FL=1|tara:strand:+ start:1907 stop:2722 length:816 start_codon:yes stop_codon:yes gene_type:complete
MQKLFESFNNWVNEQATQPAAQKTEILLSTKAFCNYYTQETIKSLNLGLPKDLHPFHVASYLKIQTEQGPKPIRGIVVKAFDLKGNERFYGLEKQTGGMRSGNVILIKAFEVGTKLEQAIMHISQKVLGQEESDKISINMNSVAGNKKFSSFSLEIASGKKQVDYCKAPAKSGKKPAAKKKAELKYDDVCNQKLVLKVKNDFSERLPGVPLKHADAEIIISICKIQRMLNNLGLNIDVDGIIGPQTVRALQIAYSELKPSKRNRKSKGNNK